MGLRINTNVPALNTSRVLSRSTQALNKSLQRLSSGLRINSASDDAAGLAIAEGFNSVVRGTQVAQRNSQDGVSLVQTSEGALSETTNILQRIRELSVQAANDINSGTNRTTIQAEITAQISELTRIGNTVDFNGSLLLDGSFSGKQLQIGAMANQTISISISGRISDLTSTIVVAGGWAAKNSACARPNSAQRVMSVTNMRVRTTSAMSAPSSCNARRISSRQRRACP